MKRYILDENHKPILLPHTNTGSKAWRNQMDKWSKFHESKERIVKRENVGPYNLSTVFLGLDLSFTEHETPILFESMLFFSDKKHKVKDMRRYSTWEEAEAGHAEMKASILLHMAKVN